MESTSYWEDVRMTAREMARREILQGIRRNLRSSMRRATRADHALRGATPDDASTEVLEMEAEAWDDDTEVTRPVHRVE